MIDIFTVMKLKEGKYYRVTEVNGKKWRGEFEKSLILEEELVFNSALSIMLLI